MKSIDIDWVKQQFAAAQVTQAVGTATLRLFEVWNTMNHTNKTAEETVKVFSKLALGLPLVAEEDPGEGAWVPCMPGAIKLADTVRVKSDAYTGEVGVMHNGRVGRVVGIRSGDIIVKTTDSRPVIDGAHYSPHQLEKWVQA